jgi:hypothetical protein
MSYIGTSPIGGTIRSQFFSGDAVTTTFNLLYEYGNEASVLVFISGVKQKTDSYAVINGQLVFSAPPPAATDNIEIIFLGGAVITTPYLSADQFGIIRINAAEITQNATISLGYNASSAGPLTVANDVTISVSNGSSWTIL